METREYLDFYRGKTVLVSGGAGAIGSNLIRALGELGVKLVIVLDDLSSAVRWNVAKDIVVAWIVTMPMSAFIAAAFYTGASFFG